MKIAAPAKGLARGPWRAEVLRFNTQTRRDEVACNHLEVDDDEPVAVRGTPGLGWSVRGRGAQDPRGTPKAEP